MKTEIEKITYLDMCNFVKKYLYCGASQDDYISDEQIHRRAKYFYNEYLNGVSLDKLFIY